MLIFDYKKESRILKVIERLKEVTYKSLSHQTEMPIVTIKFYLKRLKESGLIEITRQYPDKPTSRKNKILIKKKD